MSPDEYRAWREALAHLRWLQEEYPLGIVASHLLDMQHSLYGILKAGKLDAHEIQALQLPWTALPEKTDGVVPRTDSKLGTRTRSFGPTAGGQPSTERTNDTVHRATPGDEVLQPSH